MVMVSQGRAPAHRTPGEVWAEVRPHVVRFAAELFWDRVHASHDAELAAYGLVVERLPWGHRRTYDPRVPAILDAARARALSCGSRVDAAEARQALADIALTRIPALELDVRRPAGPTDRPIVPAALAVAEAAERRALAGAGAPAGGWRP